jgi:uncharacterized repeat protein (TIGR01451 family)
VPSSITLSFVATIPSTATVGTYHNPVGAVFLDPTRNAASTRTVSPLTAVTANRLGLAYAPSTYNNYAGNATTSVGGSNFSGLPGGPSTDDVRLVADFSITKTAAASATPGSTFTYTLAPRNNGRAVASQTYLVTQASDVSTANIGSLLGSAPVTLTDTLPAGITMASAFAGTGWTCAGTSTVVCTLADATAYPIAASTNFPVLTGVATMGGTCSPVPAPRTNAVVMAPAAGESLLADNTATAVTSAACVSANLSLTKDDGVATATAGGTVTYTLTISNGGPSAANGSVVNDTPSAGLNCTSVACSGTTGGALCPTVGAGAGQLSIANLLAPGSGVTLATLPSASSVTLKVACGVTATGAP